MTSAMIVRVVEHRPFEPFLFALVDGRELTVAHPESIMVGRAVTVVFLTLPTRQVEVIDIECIVSIRSVYPVPADTWTEREG